MDVRALGIDLEKNLFHIHGVMGKAGQSSSGSKKSSSDQRGYSQPFQILSQKLDHQSGQIQKGVTNTTNLRCA